ncbi:transcriptional regulator domain-containing protein [Sphingobium boeckii]|uniref:transcriptional regulator domain-containing protein n=1 Tax=Sphingobium boeckii TaxID=1082345 RepID=UPI003CCD5AC5
MEPKIDWRSGRDYAHLGGLPGPCFAWEFLRRNQAYRSSAPRSDGPEDQAGIRIIRPNLEEARFFARWGLIFRGRAGM